MHSMTSNQLLKQPDKVISPDLWDYFSVGNVGGEEIIGDWSHGMISPDAVFYDCEDHPTFVNAYFDVIEGIEIAPGSWPSSETDVSKFKQMFDAGWVRYHGIAGVVLQGPHPRTLTNAQKSMIDKLVDSSSYMLDPDSDPPNYQIGAGSTGSTSVDAGANTRKRFSTWLWNNGTIARSKYAQFLGSARWGMEESRLRVSEARMNPYQTSWAWISPQGEFIELDSLDTHEDWAAEHGARYHPDTRFSASEWGSSDKLVDHGWVQAAHPGAYRGPHPSEMSRPFKMKLGGIIDEHLPLGQGIIYSMRNHPARRFYSKREFIRWLIYDGKVKQSRYAQFREGVELHEATAAIEAAEAMLSRLPGHIEQWARETHALGLGQIRDDFQTMMKRLNGPARTRWFNWMAKNLGHLDQGWRRAITLALLRNAEVEAEYGTQNEMLLMTVGQLRRIISEAVARYPQGPSEEMQVLSLDWTGRDVHVTLDDQDIVGQFDEAYKNLGKLIGKDSHMINDLLTRRDEGDSSAVEELIRIVYEAAHVLIDRHGPTHVHDTKSNVGELVPVEVWQKSYGMAY